jgi:hypothetical protein
MVHTEASVRADARLVREIQEEIDNDLNPPEFDDVKQKYPQKNEATKLLDKEFEIFDYVYKTIWPNEEKLPQEWRPTAAQARGQPVQTELKAFLAIPRKLLQSKSPVAIKIIDRHHGGGGVSILKCCGFLTSANPRRRRERRSVIHGHTKLPSITYLKMTT